MLKIIIFTVLLFLFTPSVFAEGIFPQEHPYKGRFGAVSSVSIQGTVGALAVGADKQEEGGSMDASFAGDVSGQVVYNGEVAGVATENSSLANLFVLILAPLVLVAALYFFNSREVYI